MKTRAARLLALILALAVLAAAAAFAVLAGHADHHCAGEDCPVCDWLTRCEAALSVFAVGLLLTAPAAVAIGAVGRDRPTRAPAVREPATPVSLGVRLRN